MTEDPDEYLQDGSPFLREVNLTVLDSMIRLLFLGQDYNASQAIARELLLWETTSVSGAISKNPGKYTFTTVEQRNRDIVEYCIGFTRPFRLLQFVLLAQQTGLEQAKELIPHFSAEEEERRFLHENLSFALVLLRSDPGGVRFINQLMLKEVAARTSLYYKVGIEAARRIFRLYTDILATLLPDSKGANGEDSAPLLSRLEKHEKNAPPLTVVQPIAPPIQLAEEMLVKLTTEEEPSLKIIWRALPSLRRFFVHQPRHIRALFTIFSRSLKAFTKNPHLTVQRLDEVDHIMDRMRDTFRHKQQPGKAFLHLSTEMNDFVGNIIPYPSYPSESFLQDIQRIRALKERLVDGEDVSSQLLEEWEKLAEQRGLEQYSALWTIICIATGDFCLQQLLRAFPGEAARDTLSLEEKRYINAARWAYTKPLEKSSVWKADLGTRYLCATRSGRFYNKYEKNLKIPTSQLARALHDLYLDMLRVNERLYQRSPYQDSKRTLQGRNDFMMARALETCVYLSQHSEEAESVQWRREAFVIAESGKSRMLREEMALAERLPPPGIPANLYQTEKECLDKLRTFYAKIAARESVQPLEPSSFDEFNTERNKLRLDLEQAWAEMEDREDDEAKAYVVARRDEALQWEGLQWDSFQRVAERLGKNFALVSISMLPGSVLFAVLRSGWDAPKLCRVDLSQNDLQEHLDNYDDEILNRVPNPGEGVLKHDWQTLGDVLFAPLVPLLDGVKYVYFLPHGVFHNLPLHALTIRDEPFIKHWGVAYAPSISVLESTLSRPKSQGSVLVMGYADPNDPGDTAREFMLEEAKKIATFFHSSHVLPEKVNAQLLREEGQPARLIHLACHGVFAEEDPLNSGVVLTDGIFTARHWLKLHLQADLVTLSACQVGISGIRPGDDLVGLTRSILFAGASSLLMSLWSVDSVATYDWMLLFYQHLQKNDNLTRKIDAFQEATLALLEKYNDPYYWAPFVLVGHP